MLWEAADPDLVLRERFGLDSAGAVESWVRHVLAEHWHEELAGCESVVMSADNALAWCTTGHGPRILKWSVDPTRFDRLADAAALTSWLADHGAPLSAPIRTADGATHVRSEQTSISLQHVVAGDLLDISNHRQVQAAGATLAQLHTLMRRYPHPTPSLTTPADDLHTQVSTWLAADTPHLPTALKERLAELLPSSPPVGALHVVHGDYRAANLILDGDHVKAVLDFEEIHLDHVVSELGRTLVLLGTKFHNWGPIDTDTRRHFLAGYQTISPLTGEHLAWIDALTLWWSLRMVPPTANGDDPWLGAASRMALLGETPRHRA